MNDYFQTATDSSLKERTFTLAIATRSGGRQIFRISILLAQVLQFVGLDLHLYQPITFIIVVFINDMSQFIEASP